ncbi:hypothetical protein ACJ5H2_17625 [Nocardioides sp. R1-1]|uniref:hypothetical protein n=1 Tax=Nocardioides sp. R1-1 TaxID=3383502 RepID=UPI0038D09CD6
MSEQPGTNPYDPRPYPVYGQGGQYFGPPPDHPQATMVLILGILGLALCQVLAPFAWVMGGRVRKEIAASNGAVGGGQMATIGWVLGIVGSCLLLLGLLAFVAYIVVIVIVVGASA